MTSNDGEIRLREAFAAARDAWSGRLAQTQARCPRAHHGQGVRRVTRWEHEHRSSGGWTSTRP